MEEEPTRVPEAATREGEIRARWAWVKPEVWTDRMLAALEEGVKGGVWFSLMDKVYSKRNLEAAYEQVRRNGGAAGVDHVTVEHYGERLEYNLERLSQALRDGSYRPKAVRRVWIPKPGTKQQRPLGIPTVEDRIVQTAMRNVAEPIFERDFAEHSYGFRPGRGCKDALRRVDHLLKAGYTWVVDADLKSYFDTIPHGRLMARVRSKIVDRQMLGLVEAFLKQKVMDTAEGWTPERGSPQGAVISPLLSNIYLDPLDHLMGEEGFEMVRYADDFLIMCRSREEADAALGRVRKWTVEAGLMLHPDKTSVIDATVSAVEFLGYRFDRGRRWPRQTSLRKFKDAIRAETKRANGHSLERIIATLNTRLAGWFGYFKHCHKFVFHRLDQWIRMRLRSILRKRAHLKGRGRGSDHQRWPNKYFADLGLFSLLEAWTTARQSLTR